MGRFVPPLVLASVAAIVAVAIVASAPILSRAALVVLADGQTHACGGG